MKIKFDAVPVSTKIIRKGWNSETTEYTFVDNCDAMVFAEDTWVCGPIGEWLNVKDNVVTVFKCSAD